MRPLVIAQVFPPALGGSGRWLWEVYRRMPRGSVHVAAGHADAEATFDLAHTLPVTRVPLQFSNWGLSSPRSACQYVAAARTIRSLSERVAPTAIHCAKALPEGALGWWLETRLGLPYWCYAHGEELTLARTSRELCWMTAKVLRGAHRVIANSWHTRGLLVADWAVRADHIVVLHPGIDTDTFVPAARDESVRARLGWSRRRVVLTVGALQKRKGQDMLIRALPHIRQHVPDVLYAVAGQGWERSYLQDLAAELNVADAVQFLGTPRDVELVECYQQCDLFALPNRQVGWDFEGFGIVLLEAQACGRAVITGMSGGTAEAVDAPRSGVVVDCSTPEAVGETVSRLLREDETRARMGARGREWCRTMFDWAQVQRRMADAFAGIPTPDQSTSRTCLQARGSI